MSGMNDIEDIPRCPDCDWDMEGDEEDLECSNPRACNAQVDKDERLLRSPLRVLAGQRAKTPRQTAPVTEAYIVDLIRRGKYKAYKRRLRNKGL